MDRQAFREHGKVAPRRPGFADWALSILALALFLGTFWMARHGDDRDASHATTLARLQEAAQRERDEAAARVAAAWREGRNRGYVEGFQAAMRSIDGGSAVRVPADAREKLL